MDKERRRFLGCVFAGFLLLQLNPFVYFKKAIKWFSKPRRDGLWHHFVITRNQNSLCSYYQDGDPCHPNQVPSMMVPRNNDIYTVLVNTTQPGEQCLDLGDWDFGNKPFTIVFFAGPTSIDGVEIYGGQPVFGISAALALTTQKPPGYVLGVDRGHFYFRSRQSWHSAFGQPRKEIVMRNGTVLTIT